MSQVVEIRSYQLHQGAAGRFERIVIEQTIPLLRAAGTDVVAFGPSPHDPGAYVLMRAYRDLAHRQHSQDQFYGSAAWSGGPRAAVLDCIDHYTTVVLAADAALLGSLRSNAVAPLAFAPAEPQITRHPAGKPGDFDFLSGEWTIQHRRLIAGSDQWDAFEGEATCWSILGGVASVEELRIPARGFSGMGLRLLDCERQVWSDFWMNGSSGVLMTPGTEGYFEDGAGIFTARDFDDGQPILVRGMWDNISPTICRWQQATSRDAGLSWQTNWIMDWSRR